MANRTAILDRMYGSEPLAINVQGIELVKLMNWYNLNSEPEDRRKWICDYAKNRLHYNDSDLSLLSSAALQMVQTFPYCARAIMKGSTFHNQLEIINMVDEACKSAIAKVRESYSGSQSQREQSRLRSAMARKVLVSEAYWSIADQLETNATNIKLDALANLTVAEMDTIKSHLEFNLEEYKAAKSDQEGYERINFRPLIKRIEGVIQSITQKSSTIKARKKTTVTRKRKPITASKQVSKLKYAKEVDGFKSINPEAILTASLLFVYDEKTRKLIKFSNPDSTRLTVVGSKVKAHTIVCRTLRKPSITLTEMRKGTIKAAERVYESLTTKDATHSGRMTEKCLILRLNAI